MTASRRSRARGPVCVAAAGAVAVVIAGCGSSTGGTLSSGGGGTASTPIPSTSAASPTGGVGRMPTSPPPGSGGVSHGRLIQVKGTLERGAEPSCLVLRTATGSYDLMGPVAQRLQPDHPIVLLGRVVTGVASHCMDGTPFEVTAIATR